MNRKYETPYLSVFSPDMKIFELVETAPSLLSIFSRLDITLPFGDISVAQMCERDGRNVDLFLIICSMHVDSSYRPTRESLHIDMLQDVVAYLRASHRYYAEHMLPHTSQHLEKILQHCDELSRNLLRRFYDDYSRYIVEHFEEEERCIFAFADSRAGGAADCSILDMPHADIDDRSNDIASLIFKSLPAAAPTQLRCNTLEHIYALRDDLRRHTKVEYMVLRPLVEMYIKYGDDETL